MLVRVAALFAAAATFAAAEHDPRGLRRERRSAAGASPTQCPSPTSKGCGALTWPVTWAMRASLYTYCYQACPLIYFDQHRELGVFGGVVGV